MKSVRAILDEFSQMGAKHFFALKSGSEYEGWIVDFSDEHILFVDEHDNASSEPLKLRLGTIDIETLSYWDEQQGRWIEARWDETIGRWAYYLLPIIENEQQSGTTPRAFLGKVKRVLRPEKTEESAAPFNPLAALNSLPVCTQ